MRLSEIVEHLNGLLHVDEIKDYPNALNGLQVEGREEVKLVMTAVDASQASSEAAAARGADLLIVHHGLFWDGLKPITGRYKKRLEPLIRGGVSVYASHLPLDAHPKLGNNSLLARALGLDVKGAFGEFMGTKIGVWAECAATVDELAERMREELGCDAYVAGKGTGTVRRACVVSGGASSCFAEAASEGMDTVITGELPHHSYLEAEELGLNVIYAGHYATETLGVKALGEHLKKKFKLKHEFFDYPTGR